MMPRVFGLDPIVGNDPRVLILGTFPGESSRKNRQYYFDNRNSFWKIINRVLNNNQGFVSYAAKTKCLKDHGVAVWDIYKSKMYTGESSNLGIVAPEFNDIKAFLMEHSTLQRIVFNGIGEPGYELVRIDCGFSKDSCFYLRQTSGRVSLRPEDFDIWRNALTVE